jgi:GNAT superfamily N-acetyltransferase
VPITFTPAQAQDTEALAGLLEELDQSNGVAEPRQQRVRNIGLALFGSPPAVNVLLAWDGRQLVGMASYSFLWPAAGSTRSLYLKEMYVASSHRRQGVGRLIMEQLRQVAADHECSRMEWTAIEGNPEAIAFYQALGYSVQPSTLFYRAKIER